MIVGSPNTNDIERALHDVLAQGPSNTLPSTRCFRTVDLRRLLLHLPTEVPITSGAAVLRTLEAAKLAQPVLVQKPGLATPTAEFIVLGLHDLGSLGPAELLQAWLPRGVLAYATAISLHQLSTQIPRFHSIVDTTKSNASTKERPRTTAHASDESAVEPSRRSDPMGTLAFEVDGDRYYVSSRSLPIAATQQIWLHALSLGRVTTVAQTLVDCLRKPLPCGGVANILEAWETGWPQCEGSAIAACLAAWGDQDVDLCRLGCLTEWLTLNVDPSLAARLEDARLRRATATIEPLFAGLHDGRDDERWRLRVPT